MVNNPGTLNKVAKLLRLKQNNKTKNGFRCEEAWEEIKTFRCSVATEESKSIRTLYKNGVVDNVDFKIITCRYFNDIKHSDRIMLNGSVYEIEVINNVEEADKYLRIWVKGNNI